MRLVLASGSPRRRELLQVLGIPFEARAPDVDERPRPGEDPRDLVVRLATEKAATAAAEGAVTVGADTEVVLDGATLGKPSDTEDAARLLGTVAGRTHTVLTGIAVGAGGSLLSRVVASRVTIRPMTEREIRWYAATGEPLDKAGAYALQGIGGAFVERIDGSHSNVIGLPLVETVELLRAAGVVWPPG